MTFPRDTLEKLEHAAGAAEAACVGALAFTNIGNMGIKPVMTIWDEDRGGAQIMSVPTDTLQPVDATGAAFLLIHRTLLEKMRSNLPAPHWFQTMEMDDGSIIGEDIGFCLKARDLGEQVWVHTGAPVGHIKDQTLDLDMWRRQEYAERAAIKHLEFVVTGTGRSGTGFISQVFTNAGMPCGHEKVFNPYETRAAGYMGDASWMAVPYLSELRSSTVVFHQMRHPLKVVRSLCGDSSLTAHRNNPYRVFKERHCDYLTFENTVMDAMRYVVDWTWRIERRRTLWWRVEDFDAANLEAAATVLRQPLDSRVAEYALNVPPWYRNKHVATDLGWDDLPDGPEKDDLVDLTGEYGYDLEPG